MDFPGMCLCLCDTEKGSVSGSSRGEGGREGDPVRIICLMGLSFRMVPNICCPGSRTRLSEMTNSS